MYTKTATSVTFNILPVTLLGVVVLVLGVTLNVLALKIVGGLLLIPLVVTFLFMAVISLVMGTLFFCAFIVRVFDI